MAEERNNSELSLDISKNEDMLCDVITVKAPNFFTLPEYGSHFKIRSPSFEFQNSSWCFNFRSLYWRKDGDRDFVVDMRRINSRVLQKRIFYKIVLLDANDKYYRSMYGGSTMQIDEDGKGSLTEVFHIRNPSFDRRDTLTFIIHLLQFNESTEQDTLKISQMQDLQNTAAERREDCKVSLTFSKVFISCNVYTLKFSNSVQVQNSSVFEWKSPSFEFDNETWCFRVNSLHPNHPVYGHFTAYLLRLSSEKKKHNKKIDEKQELTYVFTLQVNDKKTFEFCSKENEKEYYLGTLGSEYRKIATLDKVTMIFYLFPKKYFEVEAANMSFTIIRAKNSLSTSSSASTAATSSADGWNCDTCFSKNRTTDSKCVDCGTPKSKKLKNAATTPPAESNSESTGNSSSIGSWLCKQCLKSNLDSETACIACHTPKSNEDKKTGFEKLSQNFRDMFKEKRDTDLTIKVQGQEFSVHKLILRARSSVFDDMLPGQQQKKKSRGRKGEATKKQQESNENVIEIDDCDPAVFEQFLLFVYSGKIENMTCDNVYGLYYAAAKYNLPDLKGECIDFAKRNFSVQNICEIMRMAIKHKETEFLSAATNYFAMNMDKILATSNWVSFLKDNHEEANKLCIQALKLGFIKKE